MADKVTLYDENGIPHTSTTVERATSLAVKGGADPTKLTTVSPTIYGNQGQVVSGPTPQQINQQKQIEAKRAFNTAQQTELTAGSTAPTGTMTAQITTPKGLQKTVAPPAVVTSDAAEKDLANKKTQVEQLQADTDAHRTAMSTPQQTPGPIQTVSGQEKTQASQDLDSQINDLFGGMNDEFADIDANTQEQLTPLQQQQQELQTQLDNEASVALKKLNKIASGTYPLSPAEKDLLSSTRSIYESTIQAQQAANTGFQGQLTEAMASLGISYSAPTQALGLMHAAISSGNEKVADLESQMAKSLAELTIGFQDSDYQKVSDAWEKTSTYMKDRITAIQDMQDAVTEAAKQQKQDRKDYTTLALQYVVKSADFSYEQKQDAVQNAFRSQEISETQRHNLQSEAVSWYNAKKDEDAGFKLTQTQTSKLLAGGLNAGDIKNIQNDVKEHGIDAVLEGLPENQRTLVKDVYSGSTEEDETKLTREALSTYFGLPDDGSKTGFLGTGETTSEKLDEVMNFVSRYKAVGYTDDEILKLLKDGQDK